MSVRGVLWIIALAVCASGCRIHLEHNAPGNVDVLEPPAEPKVGEVEIPDDPGERFAYISAGPFAAGGVGVTDESGFTSAGEVGAEISLQLGERKKSHRKPTLFSPLFVLIEPRQGVNLGMVLIEPAADNPDEVELGPVYLEYQRAENLGGWSAGYAVDATDGSHGPMATVFFTGLYLRASYRFGRGPAVMLGVTYKFPVSLIWSR